MKIKISFGTNVLKVDFLSIHKLKRHSDISNKQIEKVYLIYFLKNNLTITTNILF